MAEYIRGADPAADGFMTFGALHFAPDARFLDTEFCLAQS